MQHAGEHPYYRLQCSLSAASALNDIILVAINMVRPGTNQQIAPRPTRRIGNRTAEIRDHRGIRRTLCQNIRLVRWRSPEVNLNGLQIIMRIPLVDIAYDLS